MTYDIGNQGAGLGQLQQCGMVKHVNEIQTFPLDNCVSDGNANFKKRTKKKKTQQRIASTQKDHILLQK